MKIEYINFIFFLGVLSFLRLSLEDVEIDGKVILKNFVIILYIYFVYYDKIVWQKLEEFKFECFIDKDRYIIKYKVFYFFFIGKKVDIINIKNVLFIFYW